MDTTETNANNNNKGDNDGQQKPANKNGNKFADVSYRIVPGLLKKSYSI